MRNMLAAFAVAFAPTFAPALAADGTNDTNDTDEQLKADIARLEGKIDTLTKTVASNAASLTTKVDDAADALAAVERQLGEGAVAIYQSIPGNAARMHFVGGNLAGAGLTRHSHIELPAGLYEVELARGGTTGPASGEEAEEGAGENSTGHRLNNVVAALFFVAAVPSLLWNVHRPLYASPDLSAYGGETKSVFEADRGYMYFNAHPSLRGPYVEAIAYLAELKPREIGLYMNADDFDYTLFPLLQERLGAVPRIEHVRVANVSGTLADNGFTPEYVFSTRGALDTVGGATYRPIAHAGRGPYATVTILKREDADRNSGHNTLRALGGGG